MNAGKTKGFRLRGRLRQHSSLLDAGMRLFDMVLVGLAGWVAHWLYLGRPELSANYELVLLIGMLLVALMLSRFGVYRAWRGAVPLNELGRITVAWAAVAAVLVVLAFFTKMGATYSRVWGGSWFMLSWVFLLASRVVLRSVLNWARAKGFNSRSVVVVGARGLGITVAEQILDAPWTGLQIVGLFGESESVVAERGLNIPIFGGTRGLLEFVNREQVDQVWLALPLSEEGDIRALVENLRNTTVDIRLVPEVAALRLLGRPITEVAGLPVVELSVSPMSGSNRVLKEIEDRVLALLILALISPLMVIIAVAVKWSSPGPVLFRQKRMTWRGEVFEMLKFRSMRVDVHHGDQRWGSAQAKPITAIGGFLRRTSLDELPQFINVLRGDMSIVGPRPELPVFVDRFKDEIPDYMKKHLVKAGITGWAQVHGFRGDTSIEKRIEYDLFYIENWSLWFDLRIILMTIFKGFVNPNAY